MAFTYDRIFRQNTNLSSRQNEFASSSGSTSVAFIIRAATTALHIYKNKTTALHIYKNKTTAILNLRSLLPSIIQNIHDKSCFRGIFLVIIILHFCVKKIIILHYVVGSSHHCTEHVNTHCPHIQAVELQADRLHFSKYISSTLGMAYHWFGRFQEGAEGDLRGQNERGAEDALQPFESAVLHNLFTSTSLNSSTDVSTRNNFVQKKAVCLNHHCSTV
jgi:hypothetical protein